MSKRPDHYGLDENHQVIPVPLEEWAKSFDKADRIVEQTFVGNYWVSTVFLGLDHDYTGLGPPLVFETMIFPADGVDVTDWGERFCQRYASWDMAAAGHRAAIEVAKHMTEHDESWLTKIRSVDVKILNWLRRHGSRRP